MKRTFLRVLCLLCAILLMGALGSCGNEEPEEPEKPAVGGDTPTAETHDHSEPAAMRLSYEDEEGGTFTLIIKDCQGDVVYKEAGLAKKALSTQVTTGVVELAWVTANQPGGYECLYINRLTCQVSDKIIGEQATDGNRIVCSEIKDGKLYVTVRDLFDKNGYTKTTEIAEAYTGGEYTVLGTVKYGKDQVNVSYLTDKDGTHRIKAFDLYENGEERPTSATQPTQSTKK